MGALGPGEDGHRDQRDLRRLDSGPGLPALPRRRADPVRGGERRPRLADRCRLRRAAGARAWLQPAGALLELHRALAGRPLGPAGHRELPDRGGVRPAPERGARPRPLARDVPDGRLARGARLEGLAVRVRHPQAAAGQRGTRRAARHPAPRPGRDPHRPAALHARRAAVCRRQLRRGPAPTVRGIRQDAARAAALPRPAGRPGRPADSAVRRHGPHPAAPHGCGGRAGARLTAPAAVGPGRAAGRDARIPGFR